MARPRELVTGQGLLPNDRPDRSNGAITMDAILEPHRRSHRMMGQQTVLCIQDGTDLNATLWRNVKV